VAPALALAAAELVHGAAGLNVGTIHVDAHCPSAGRTVGRIEHKVALGAAQVQQASEGARIKCGDPTSAQPQLASRSKVATAGYDVAVIVGIGAGDVATDGRVKQDAMERRPRRSAGLARVMRRPKPIGND
jgi:hypothetical protein